MSKIIGITVGTRLPKPNFKQTDPTKGDYIRNKPNFAEVATSGNWNDLTDKPFGIEPVEGSVFPETTLEVNTEEGAAMITEPLLSDVVADQTYIVNWNGTKYERIANIMSLAGVMMSYIGNIGPVGMGDDTGEPFLFMAIPSHLVEAMGGFYAAAYAFDGSTSVTLSVGRPEIKKLDNKYLDLYWLPTEHSMVETEFISERETTENGHLTISGNEIDESMFAVGTKIVVYIDSERYESTVASIEQLVYAGNMSLFFENAFNTGEPYFIIVSEDAMHILTSSESIHKVSVYVYAPGQNKLPNEFIPNEVALKEYVDEKLSEIGTPSVEGLASKSYVDEKVAAIEIPSIDGLASETYVDEKVAENTDYISLKANTVKLGNECIYDIAFGGDKFVAISWAGRMIYSTDGNIWNAVDVNDDVLNNGSLIHIAYGNGRFVAISAMNVVFSSDNGIDWVKTANITSDVQVNRLIFGNGKFITYFDNLTSDTRAMYYSEDGIDWIDCTSVIQGFEMNGLKFANDKFFAYGDGYDEQKWSNDGLVWNKVNYPDPTKMSSFHIEGICYANGRYVAACCYGIARVSYYKFFYSNDGINWVETDYNYARKVNVLNICYGNGRFVMVSQTDTDTEDTVYISNDGITWKSCIVPALGPGVYHIAFGNGKFVCFNKGNTKELVCSDDGISWVSIVRKGADIDNTLSELLAGKGLANKIYVDEKVVGLATETYVDDKISELGGRPILTDTVTGINYELYVENGKLTMKETGVLGGKAILKDSMTGANYELYVENGNLTMKEAE